MTAFSFLHGVAYLWTWACTVCSTKLQARGELYHGTSLIPLHVAWHSGQCCVHESVSETIYWRNGTVINLEHRLHTKWWLSSLLLKVKSEDWKIHSNRNSGYHFPCAGMYSKPSTLVDGLPHDNTMAYIWLFSILCSLISTPLTTHPHTHTHTHTRTCTSLLCFYFFFFNL